MTMLNNQMVEFLEIEVKVKPSKLLNKILCLFTQLVPKSRLLLGIGMVFQHESPSVSILNQPIFI